jgi:predicted Zn-dependent protease
MAARRALLILGALCLGAAAGCIQDDGRRFDPIGDMTNVSEDEEREIGLQFDEELRKQVDVIDDPVVAGFIHELGQEIVDTLEPQPFVYRFRVIRANSLNAFAVPGGYVYFHSETLLAAGSLDELAGVMGHEIAHVKAHHYARMRKKSQIPDILAGVLGMAAAVATGRPEPLVASQGANVALKLRWSREFEAEADRYGTIFMARAGWEPAGIARFFQRLVELEKSHPNDIPPYLYSHPDVEQRIQSVQQQAAKLKPVGTPDPRLEEDFRDAQARLAWMVAHDRDSVPPPSPPEHPERIAPLLARADDLAQERQLDEALLVLARAESLEPNDPRVPFQIGELLALQGRYADAALAYRRAVRLDPTRALVFYRMGLVYKADGDRHNAVYAFEQASRRAGASSTLRRRADWQIETMIFPVLLERGFAEDAGERAPGDPGLTEFPAEARRIAWYGRLHSRYEDYPEHMSLRWTDPRGQVAGETPVEERSGPWLVSVLELPEPGAPGEWRVDVLYERDVLESESFRVQPSR